MLPYECMCFLPSLRKDNFILEDDSPWEEPVIPRIYYAHLKTCEKPFKARFKRSLQGVFLSAKLVYYTVGSGVYGKSPYLP